MSTWYGATECLGEHPAPSLFNSSFNIFVLFIVSRASSEYISERLDSSTHFRFTMPQHPDSLNRRPGWTSSSTVTCGPSTGTVKTGCTSSTAGSFSTPFAWAGFAVGISNHSRKGQNPNGEPSWHRTKNTKPRNTYDIIKYAKEFKKGNTTMKNYGDPQSQMCHIGSFLSEVYDDARLVNLAVGEPKPRNLTQIHDEVMKKLECMAYAYPAWHPYWWVSHTLLLWPKWPYRRCTPWRSYELPASSPLWPLQLIL